MYYGAIFLSTTCQATSIFIISMIDISLYLLYIFSNAAHTPLCQQQTYAVDIYTISNRFHTSLNSHFPANIQFFE
jgi:biopolymer transport protein ExbD